MKLVHMFNSASFRSQPIRHGQMRQQSPVPLLSPTDTMETLYRQPEKLLVGTISLVLILLRVFTWVHFLRTTSTK